MPTLNDPVAFEIAGFEVRWYAIFILVGIVSAIAISGWLARARGMDPDFLLDAAPWIVVAGIIGARLYYVLLKWRFFVDNPNDIVAIREGGLAVHGAIAGGVIAFWCYCRIHQQPALLWGDLLAASVPFGQAIGRWGNWANQEAFGRPSELPWAIAIGEGRRPTAYVDATTFHPTFLYESLLDLAIGCLLVLVVLRIPNRRFRIGDAVFLYLVGYGAVRLLVESLRIDSVYAYGFRVAHLVSLGLILVGLIGLLMTRRTRIAPIERVEEQSNHESTEEYTA